MNYGYGDCLSRAASIATAQILDAEDFKEIGIKVGTRKKLLERLASSTSEA